MVFPYHLGMVNLSQPMIYTLWQAFFMAKYPDFVGRRGVANPVGARSLFRSKEDVLPWAACSSKRPLNFSMLMGNQDLTTHFLL